MCDLDKDQLGITARVNLEVLAGEYDVERAHSEADSIMCELLTRLGFEDVVQAWENVPKWYA